MNRFSPSSSKWNARWISRPMTWVFSGILVLAMAAVFISISKLRNQNGPDETKPEEPVERVSFNDFADLPGWSSGKQAGALPALGRSCPKLLKGRPQKDDTSQLIAPVDGWTPAALKAATKNPSAWVEICTALRALLDERADLSHADARAFLEQHFQPVFLSDTAGASKFTGYFEPTYAASVTADGKFTTPVLSQPSDLISVQLGDFDPDLAGKRIAGRIEGGRLRPYADHAEIIETIPAGSEPLAYIDPNDLLFLQIQGSGRLAFEDGTVRRVGYATQNGHSYVAIGRTLVEEGHLPIEAVTMQSIRKWLDEAPREEAAAVRYSNPSYVFFQPLNNLPDPELGPLGAQSVQLTPNRSLAVDHRYYAYGTPVWLQTDETDRNGAITSLFIAQDTGGAIRGPQRGDVYFGAGEEAATAAGTMNAPGEMFILLPKLLFSEAGHEPS